MKIANIVMNITNIGMNITNIVMNIANIVMKITIWIKLLRKSHKVSRRFRSPSTSTDMSLESLKSQRATRWIMESNCRADF